MRFVTLVTLLFMPLLSWADTASWKVVGSGEMHQLFWHVYNTTLTTPSGVYDPAKPYALENHYFMNFTAKELAERSIKEMRRHATFSDTQAAQWQQQLEAIWPDVKEGDRIRAIAIPSKKITFLHNGNQVGDIDDKQFVKPFMDIWLGENTSEPTLRLQLLQHP